jgi:hypothetical protein
MRFILNVVAWGVEIYILISNEYEQYWFLNTK